MKFPFRQLARPFTSTFNALAGKHGARVSASTVLTIAIEGAAIGIGTAALVGAWPITLLTVAGSLLVTGTVSAINTAGAISQRKHHAKMTAMEEKTLDLERQILETNQQLLREQQKSSQAPTTRAPRQG